MPIFQTRTSRRPIFSSAARPTGAPRRPFASLDETPPPPPISFGMPDDPGLGPQPAGVGTPAYFRQSAAIERGLRAENMFGIGPVPLLPGSTLPQRRIGTVFDQPSGEFAGTGEQILTPRNVFTTEPTTPATLE